MNKQQLGTKDQITAQAESLTKKGLWNEAADLLARAFAAQPEELKLQFQFASTLHGAGRLEEAEMQFRDILRRFPSLIEAHANLGNALYEQGRNEEAELAYRNALAHPPPNPLVLKNLALMVEGQGRHSEAISLMEQALAVDPTHTSNECTLAFMQLRSGDYVRGWRTYEARLRLPEMASVCVPGVPQWRGESLHGRSVLLTSEQGLGDTLQFVRYAPLVAARGAKVFLEVQQPLVSLLTGTPGVQQVIAAGPPRPKVDYFCPLLSLPLAFGTTLETIPAPPKYLSAPTERVTRWKAWLDAHCLPGNRRVGLVWAGGFRPELKTAYFIDRRRSMSLTHLAPLAGISGVSFVSLQLLHNSRGSDPVPEGLKLLDPMPEVTDFADTAGLIEGLDLVIAVDTSVAHLAAGLGCPVWVLSRFDACWRWLYDREESPWYPSLRHFRQPRPGDWGAVVAKVVRELREG